MTILAIANQKGGVGKTTTACTLAYMAAQDGKRVLLIDADAQCNSTDTSRAQSDGVSTLYDLIINKDSEDCVQHTPYGYDIIAGDPLLRDADKMLSGFADVFVLKEQMEAAKLDYDLIIIDTPPALGTLLMASLTAATTVLVPMTADRYAAQGISRLARSIADTQGPSDYAFPRDRSRSSRACRAAWYDCTRNSNPRNRACTRSTGGTSAAYGME